MTIVNIPSGYGSISTSPSLPPPVLQAPDFRSDEKSADFRFDNQKKSSNNDANAKKKVSSERSSFEQGSPGDLDSGCPGSERSASTIFQHNLVMTRNLSHVAEEVVTSMTPSSEPIRELHSITDLSSDEKEDQFDIEISKV